MQVVLVVNPFATRVSDAKLAAVEAELRRVAELTVVKTERPRHATELVAGRVQRRLRGGDRLLRRRRLQRGAERARRRRADRLPPGRRHERAAARARASGGSGRRGAAARRRDRAAPDAADHARPRQRPPLRVQRRSRARRCGRAPRRRDGPRRRTASGRATSRSRSPSSRVLAANRGRLDPALELEGLGRAAFVFVANATPYTYAKWIPLPTRARGRLRARPRRRGAGPTCAGVARADGAPRS